MTQPHCNGDEPMPPGAEPAATVPAGFKRIRFDPHFRNQLIELCRGGATEETARLAWSETKQAIAARRRFEEAGSVPPTADTERALTLVVPAPERIRELRELHAADAEPDSEVKR